ncbi:hypothetical protein ACFSTC_17675 [Nonomuraea ferruginea]
MRHADGRRSASGHSLDAGRCRVTGMVWRAVWRRPGQVARIGAWSVLEALPAFLIGHAVARAIEDGFAAGSVGTGLGWLAALGGAWVVAALAARQVVLAVAAVAEPFRDDLLTRVVEGAVREGQDSSAVARAGMQVELARDAFAAVVTTVRGFAFTAGGVLLGMLTLAPGGRWCWCCRRSPPGSGCS